MRPKVRGFHVYAVVLFIMGTLFPPLGTYLRVFDESSCRTECDLYAAVAARFGIGKDFWLNLLLTICGYIPGVRCSISPTRRTLLTLISGHVHNFYIQVGRWSMFHLLMTVLTWF